MKLIFTTGISDQDGYGDNSNPTPGCETQTPPTGYVADNTDCNDNNANVSPGTLEFCNGIDDDCDGKSDEECLTSKPPIVSISI
ncbi:MAG: putative metal-binding motif-containing protein [Segetibacter sp.]